MSLQTTMRIVGIIITTAGSISLSSVDARYNQTGIKIDNTSGIGTVTLNTITASNNNNMNGITHFIQRRHHFDLGESG